LSAEVGKLLQAAQDALKAGNFKDALSRVAAAEAMPALSPYERYIILRLKAPASFGAGDLNTAVVLFESIIESPLLAAAERLSIAETTVKLLDPGAGKTKTAYMWAYGRGVFDPYPGVVYDFCIGRGAQFPFKFLDGWVGTLVRDGYAGYEKMLLLDDRFDAGCMAHSRRKFDELIKFNASPVAAQALQRIAWLYRIEADAKDLPCEQRLLMRQLRSQPLCDSLHTWLTLERRRVPDGSGIAGAIDYSLKRWAALTRFLLDGDVPIDNNHIENQMRPWGVGRKNWLFVGSELAGERAAMIMSLLQSARLNKIEPWVYLKDVLTRLPTQLNSKLDELLPHLWKPAIAG